LEQISKNETKIVLPVHGEILATRVRLCIAAGLVDLNKCLKEATVRVDIVIRLISMLKDSGHPDFQRVNMREVDKLAWNLVPRNTSGQEATFPVGIEDLFDATEPGESESDDTDHDHEDKNDGTTDKAATPAERIQTMEELRRNMERMRPQLLLAQRDSDANRNVQESRANALASLSSIDMETGSNLIEQFKTEYIGSSTLLSLSVWADLTLSTRNGSVEQLAIGNLLFLI
jgi:hypothetical protein